MGKIVKYCSSCDEGFAEKFGFCPNCGATLQAFEMNPVMAGASPVIAAEPAPPVIEPVVAAPEPAPPVFIAEAAPVAAVVIAPVTEQFNAPLPPQELVTEFAVPEPEPEAAIEEPVVEAVK